MRTHLGHLASALRRAESGCVWLRNVALLTLRTCEHGIRTNAVRYDKG